MIVGLLYCILIVVGVWAMGSMANRVGFLPLCSPDNLKPAELSKGVWLLEPDGTFTLAFDHCRLRQFGAREAKRCLQHSHLVFMGDSLTRYLYLSLTYMLTTGGWAPKLSHSTNGKFPASIMWEKDFFSWGEFYRVSNGVLNDPSSGTYEVCDCYRPNVLFNMQEKSMRENRHFRQYGSARQVSGAAHETVGPVLRLSYIQFYGPMPQRGLSRLSLSLPLAEAEFNAHLRAAGEDMCPSSLIPHNYTAVSKVMAREYQYPPMKTLPPRDALLPMTPYCSQHIQEARLNNDFPQFWSDLDGQFDDKVLKSMGPTHLIINIGWHAPFTSQGKDEQKDKQWLRRRISSARQNFVSSGKHHHLRLPQVTWRGSTAFSVFGQYNDRIARELQGELAVSAAAESTSTRPPSDASGIGNSSAVEALGLVELWELTADLWAIQEWVREYRKYPFDAARFADNSTFNGEEPTTPELQQIQAARALKFRLSPDLLRVASRKGVVVAVKLITIFLDQAHPQPYVYSELNNAFLNSVCHT
jgi:hypothetical protein